MTIRHRAWLKRFRNHQAETLVILLLALLPFLFFWRLYAPQPVDRLGIREGDFTEQYFPLRAFTAGEWVAGRVPLWNPALFGGQPTLADPQSGALYPPHVLEALILGWSGIGFPIWALELQVVLHFSLAGVGAYLLGRHWAGESRATSQTQRLVGLALAITFTYGGFLTGFPVQQMTILAVSAWLPWVMWTLSRTLRSALFGDPLRRTLGRAGWTGLAFAMAILAGHPQTVMYIVYLTLAYTLFVAVTLVYGPDPVSGKDRFMGVAVSYGTLFAWALSLGLGALIAAAQLGPTLEFIGHSLRAGLSYDEVSRGLPVSELMSILYPGYFGGSPAYVGIVPLVLITVALAIGPPGLRRVIRFWLWVGVIAMLLAFGGNTFLYPLFYLLAPGFDLVRQQERAFLLYTFAAAVMTGYGAFLLSRPLPRSVRPAWRQVQRNLQRIGWAALALTGLFIYGATAAAQRGVENNLLFGVLRHHVFGLVLFGGTLLLLALRPRRLWRRWWGVALIIGWLGFNLFSVNWRFNLAERTDPPPFAPVDESLFLRQEIANLPQPARIASAGLLRGGNNAASVLGLEDVTGNTPLQLAKVAAFNEAMQESSWRYWQLMNVRYVVSDQAIDGPGLVRRYEGERGNVYQIGDPFPRARMVHQVIQSDDWSILAQESTDLKTTALIPADLSLNLATSPQPSSATIIELYPGALTINVNTIADGLLVISNIDYPGWQATLNGMPAEIYPTNGIFQGIFIPAGEHQVRLWFAPQRFYSGLWLSGMGLLVALGLIWIGRR